MLVVVAIGAVAMVAVLTVFRSGAIHPVEPLSPESAVPLLVAFALLCITGLTVRRRPSTAWLAAVGTLIVVTVDLAAVGRAVRPFLDADAWRWMGVVIGVAAVLATAAAAAYAAAPARRIGPVALVAGIVGVVAVLAAAAWASVAPADAEILGTGSSPLGATGLVTRTFLVASIALVVIGIVGELMPSIRRARHRVALEPAGSPAATLSALVRALGDELSPGRSRAHRAAVAERTRIARDLHADVMPGLRRALVLAEAGAPPERIATVLRETLDEVEAIGTSEHPIQLEVGGLIPALEWLAEQVEGRSAVSVTIDVEEGAEDREGSPPPEVAAAAFRVAALALDNVGRHAPQARVAIRALVERRRVALAIVDDGPGFVAEAATAATAAGRRGLSDMAAEATGCGASLDVGPGDGGIGTAVRFAWSGG